MEYLFDRSDEERVGIFSAEILARLHFFLEDKTSQYDATKKNAREETRRERTEEEMTGEDR